MTYEQEERAAIYEFDAGMTREQAEARAFAEAVDKNLGIPPEMMKPHKPMTQSELF